MAATLTLANQVAFGGNQINFTVTPAQHCTVSSANVLFTGSIWQHWTTKSRRTTGTGKNRRTRTVTHHHRRTTPLLNVTIPLTHAANGNFGPGQPIQGQFILSPSTLPSIDHRNCKLQYSLTANLSTSSGVMQSPPVPLAVLVPMGIQMWQQPSARAESRNSDVTCCCCIPRGKIAMNFRMSKTVIALDRDQIQIEVDIDNSQGEAKVSGVDFVLLCEGRVTGMAGTRAAFFSMEAGRTRLNGCEIKETKTVKAVMPLRPLAPPTFTSPIVVLNYTIRCCVNIDWAHDVDVAFDNIFVAHSVDFGNHFQMSQFQQFQPMENPQQPMMYTPPPPPPGGGSAGLEMTPSSFFTDLPPLQFETLPTGDDDGEMDTYGTEDTYGTGDNDAMPQDGYDFDKNDNNNNYNDKQGMMQQPLM